VTPPPQHGPQPPQIAAAALIVPLFAMIAVCLVGLSAYFAFVQHLSFAQPRVWGGLVIAAYFAWRAAMTFTKYKAQGGGTR
jgi:hypothetical protein